MEHARFDLKESIDKFVESINREGNITSSDKAELVGHLYDATEVLKQTGLNDEESFIIASKRLGNKDVLTEEYGKVNASIYSHRIWIYLWLGFVVFYIMPMIIISGATSFYFFVYKNWGDSDKALLCVTGFHLLIAFLFINTIRHKNNISRVIEIRANINTKKMFYLSLIPVVICYIGMQLMNALKINSLLEYPLRKFQNSYVEFSFYFCSLCAIALLSLLIRFSKNDEDNLKSLFERPSISFLIVMGIMIELLAAGSRVLNINILINATIFGTVYFLPSLCISYYNSQKKASYYITIFGVFGLIMEVFVGIDADISRGGTWFTAYFVGGMLIGIASGKFLGAWLANKRYVTS